MLAPLAKDVILAFTDSLSSAMNNNIDVRGEGEYPGNTEDSSRGHATTATPLATSAGTDLHTVPYGYHHNIP